MSPERRPASGAAHRRRFAAPLFAGLALAWLMTACASGRVSRPAPADAVTREWPAHPGSEDRAGFAAEPAPQQVAIAWERRVGRGLVAPLIVDGPLLVAATTDHRVVALETATGARYWFRRLSGPLNGGLVLRHGRIFAATDEREATAAALDVARGGPIWRVRLGPAPVSPSLAGDTVLVATEAGFVHALAAQGGTEYWRTELPGRAVTPPVAHHTGILVATTVDSLFRLDPVHGDITGRLPLPGRASAPPALRGDTLYLPVHPAGLVAADVASMEEAWRVALRAASHAAPVAAADGAIFLLTEDGGLWRAPPGGRSLDAVLEPGGAARASLALAADGVLVGRLDGTLILLRPDGTVLWKVQLDGPIAAPASLEAGAIYVPLLHGTIVKLVDPAAAGARGPIPVRRGLLLRAGKWATAVGTGVAAGSAIAAHTRAERRHREADRLCAGLDGACGDGAAVLDPEIARVRGAARSLDNRARGWLLGAHVALAATVLLFVLDVRGDAVPPNIIYDPDRLYLRPTPGGGMEVGVRLPVPR